MAAFSAGPASRMTSSRSAEGGDKSADVVVGEPAAGLVAGLADIAGECCGAFGFDLSGPFGDGLRVGSGVEGGLVAGEAGVAVGEGGLGVLGWRGGLGGGGRGLGCLHLADGLGEPVGREDDGEPSVDGGQDVRFAEVDVARVADVAGEGVFLRVAAPVVGDHRGCTGLASGARRTRSTAGRAGRRGCGPAGRSRGWPAGRARRRP